MLGRRAYLYILIFVGCLALGFGALGARPLRAATGPRTLTVTPAQDLKNQVVRVSWSGFTPTSSEGAFTVSIFQCHASPSSLDDCFQSFRPPASGDPLGSGIADGKTLGDGTGSAFLEVRPSLDLPLLACTATSPCSVVAFENDGEAFPTDRLPTTAVTAPLTFARSPADCPIVATPDVVTGGEGSSAHALYTWSAAMCTGANPLALDYTENSSNEGRRNFAESIIDVGLTSLPLDRSTEQSQREFAYAPIDMTGVVIAFNVTDTLTGQRITDMNLTPRLVALLIAGSQPGGPGTHLFADPEFLALNPGHSWPQNTQPPLLRAEKNADTHLVTRWLQEDAAARTFLDGNEPDVRVDAFWQGVEYPTDIFDARNPNTAGSYKPRNGTITNTRRLFNFEAPGDGQAVSALVDGILGIIDAVTARKFGLPVAKLRAANAPADAPFVAPDDPGLVAGYEAMVPNSNDATLQADVRAVGGAYPLTKIDYAMVPLSGISEAKARDIAAFLAFAAVDGQAPGVLPPGYLPLPGPLRAQTVITLAFMVAAAQHVPATTTTTAPPASGPTTTAAPGVSSAGDGETDASTPSGTSPFVSSFPGLSGGGGLGSNNSSIGDSGVIDAAPVDEVGLDGDGTDREPSAEAQPISAHFLGSESNLVLPILLIFGLGALVFGPVAMAAVRRSSKPRAEPA